MLRALLLIRYLAAGSLLATTATAAADFGVPSGEYYLDKTHAYITFTYSHLGFSNPHVSFDSFDVSLNADVDSPENSKIDVTIDAASINSRVDEFDDHLNGEDFFDTGKFPEITFKSTSFKQTGDMTFDVTGDLTIKGVTKPVTLAATVNKAGQHPMLKIPDIGFSATTKLSRTEFGLGAYAPAVGDEVEIFITAELFKKQ